MPFLTYNLIKKHLPTDICPTRNWQLFLILIHSIYSKCEDKLQTLNVYQVTEKEHQVVDR